MREGDIVASRYRIRRQAGSGAMGTVYEAFDTVEGAPVALKTWRAAPDTEPRARSRLWREAHALAELRHPAIVRYVDHGTSAEHGPFLAMAWIAGETLADRLQARGLRPAEALRLTVRLAEGLAAMHAAGVVHRDLKPSNVMLAGGDVESAIIVDFGVARVERLAPSAGGERGGHLGTARYMAPEQIRNARTVDGRADVFALGCILFEALTGRPAFEGIDPVIVLARILFEALPVPSVVRTELPVSFDRLVLSMLARELDRRPVAAALDDLVREAEVSVGAARMAELAASPVDVTREGEELELTSAAESSRDRLAPLSRHLARRPTSGDVTRSLPAASGVFVGREEESRHLAGLLRAGTRVVTVWGSPGVGKTRLIAEAVRHIAGQGESPWDEIVFGDLADARDADDMVRILARVAGVALESSLAPEVALGNALGKLGRVLLVVDPVDHVATPLAAALVAWNHAAPGLQLVSASRSRWRPPGAIAIEVGPLTLTRQRGEPSAAASLFLDRARQHWPAADRTVPDARGPLGERVEQLVAALDGIPLAIELYAARLPVLGMDALLARAPGRSDSDTTLDASEGAMTRAVAWSWNLLNPAEQRAFAQCAVFRGGFTVEAAEQVVQPGETAPVDLIQSLRDKSLLSSWAIDAMSEVRLTMFASVREFAWRMLMEAPDFVDTLRRHAAHYAHTLAPGPKGVPVEATARVEREAENLFAAAEFSLSEEGADVGAGLLSLMALEPAMVARGAIGSYRALLDRAVEVASAPGTPPPTELLGARVRQIRARLDAPRGQADRASEDLTMCLRAAERAGDAHWRGEIELDLGVVHHLRRDLGAARQSYETALELLRAADDARAEGRCIGNLGALCHDEGDFPAAARWYRLAIALFEEAGDARQRANCIGNLAVLEQDLGRRDAARELYERAVQLLETIGDARLLAITLGNFGVLELETGRAEAALALHERSLALLSGAGDRRSEALCLGRLAAALALLGKIEEAEAKLARGERLAPRGDVLVFEAVRLQGAILDAARGKNAASVQKRIERVSLVNAEGRSLRDQSDDIRSTLRILEAELDVEPSAPACGPGHEGHR